MFRVRQPALNCDLPDWQDMMDWLFARAPDGVEGIEELAKHYQARQTIGDNDQTIWVWTFDNEEDAALFRLQWGM